MIHRCRRAGARDWIELVLARPDAASLLAQPACRARLIAICPDWEATVGFDQESPHHHLSVDRHCLAVLGHACRAGAPLELRLAALCHDIGKPAAAWRDASGRLRFGAQANGGSIGHERAGAAIAAELCERLGYRAGPLSGQRISGLVAEHMPRRAPSAAEAARLLDRLGPAGARQLCALRRFDALAKGSPPSPESLARITRMGELIAAA